MKIDGMAICPECDHELWLHASGDLTRPQHCRRVVEEYEHLGAGKYGGTVYQSVKCKCKYLIEKQETP